MDLISNSGNLKLNSQTLIALPATETPPPSSSNPYPSSPFPRNPIITFPSFSQSRYCNYGGKQFAEQIWKSSGIQIRKEDVLHELMKCP